MGVIMEKYCRECPFVSDNKKYCEVRLELVRELLVFAPSFLSGASNCNRLYHLKRKGEKQLYEKYGYKIQ